MPRRPFRAVALCVLGACCAVCQTPQGAQKEPGTVIRLSTKEVVLDMVVRDKHGHLVNDLRPDEIAVYEDGIRQKITSFQNVRGREQLTAEAAARAEEATPDVAHSLNSLREVNFVSIVFAPMQRGNLAFAREAVRELLKSDVLPNTYITIYKLDTMLRLVEPYTSDKAALLAAVDRVAKGNYLLKSDAFASTIITNPGPGGSTLAQGAWRRLRPPRPPEILWAKPTTIRGTPR